MHCSSCDLELHKAKALISVHWARVVKQQTLIRKKHLKINYLMLQNGKNNGNVVKFSICPVESISDLVRENIKHLSLIRVNYFSRTNSPGFLELALDFFFMQCVA